MNSYKQSITDALTELGRDQRTLFIGYGLKAGRSAGTLAAVAESQIVETPVAEGLMVSLAIGLSLKGRLPVVIFERADFLMNAMDAIVNHLSAMGVLSRGEFNPAVIFRVTVGNRWKPLYTGPVHTANPSESIQRMVGFQVIELSSRDRCVEDQYRIARERQLARKSTMLFDFKDYL